MSKKDYELIAATIRNLPSGADGGPWAFGQRREVAEAFATALAGTNPRFARARFIAACMGQDSVDSAGRKVRYASDPLAGQRS